MVRIIFACLVALTALSTVTFAEVLDCKGRNEEYQCGSACQTTCKNLGEPCPIVNIKCNDACYCKEGYARDTNDRCISIAKCPRK